MEELINDKKKLSSEIGKLINDFMSKHGDMGIDIETGSKWDGNKEGKLTYIAKVIITI